MKISLIIPFLFFLLTLVCNAQNLQPATPAQQKEILAQIAQTNANTSSFECPFVQKKNISVLSEAIESKGAMYYKKADKLRWQYDTPYKYIFVLNGDKVFVKNESRTDEFNTSSNKLFREISELIVGSVNGTMLTDEKRFGTEFRFNDKIVEVKLVPKNKELKQLMGSIVLTFSKSDWMVQSIVMNETGGDNTIITFTEKHVNKTLSGDLFLVH
jgi:outer membrane lipoprotein-sorting protein